MLRPLALVTALAISLGLACGGGDGDATATIVVIGGEGEGVELTVELARTAGERSRGLMFREELAEDGGMLFVYVEDTEAGFWMKDTLIPLSIAFIAADGTILDVQDMEPLSENTHRPPEPYRYGLEVNQGWFRKHGLGRGDRVEIPDSVSEVTEGE
jgi:uncharacterized membrane protein (UPF0127 family)